VNAAVVAFIAENTVIALAIVTGGLLFRQGGGLQLKSAPAPKAPPQPKGDAEAKAKPDAAETPKTGPVPLEKVS
jgi:hypothetical protein